MGNTCSLRPVSNVVLSGRVKKEKRLSPALVDEVGRGREKKMGVGVRVEVGCKLRMGSGFPCPSQSLDELFKPLPTTNFSSMVCINSFQYWSFQY